MTTIQIRIDEKTKKSANKIINELGLDMSSAIKLYLRQIIRQKGIPLNFVTENGFTVQEELEILQASEEAKRGINVDGPFTPEEFMAELDKLKRK